MILIHGQETNVSIKLNGKMIGLQGFFDDIFWTVQTSIYNQFSSQLWMSLLLKMGDFPASYVCLLRIWISFVLQFGLRGST